MTSRDLVIKTIKGENNMGQTPVYGWVSANLSEQISNYFGSVEKFEDHYAFDMAHIFGGPGIFAEEIHDMNKAGVEVTPEIFLQYDLTDPNNMEDYQSIVKAMEHHRQRGRFCYLQTNGIFECLNEAFGIENHLMYLALYPDELKEVYRRVAQWNRQFALNSIELGMDMIHISDDWGSQTGLMFSPKMWRELIFPYHKITADAVRSAGAFLSLHSDGCILDVLDGVHELGYQVIHPWQETAGMPYDVYLEKYADKFAILGGLCVQSTLGFNDLSRLESEIKRVFSLLKGKRWLFCTTHFVQEHCSIDELIYAFNLITKLAKG
ncbi:MAG: hypothetical protein GX824_00455 [Clostridiales bacterium]|jgi:uroporphyrinogen decarboxylase|nr:hypothetical protein [Clostridiales bacterium]